MNSSQSTFDGKSGVAGTGRHYRRLSAERAAAGIRRLLSTLAFWGAIALPALYLPLFVNGIETVDRLGLFLGLFGLHVLALVGGRRRHVEP
jgi:hypothetical protein